MAAQKELFPVTEADAITFQLIERDESLVREFHRPHILTNYAVLKLAVQSDDPELLELYAGHVAKHNASLDTTLFPNSGFDLFVPEDTVFDDSVFRTKMMNLQVRCEMLFCDKRFIGNGEEMDMVYFSSPFLLHPRSSMSKTPLMLANHTGIIDSGYRGDLIAALRCFPSAEEGHYVVAKHTRLFQICHPSLCPIYVVLTKTSELSSTERGAGGFGSTGVGGATTA
jgi:dUTP pyrophosphatase